MLWCRHHDKPSPFSHELCPSSCTIRDEARDEPKEKTLSLGRKGILELCLQQLQLEEPKHLCLQDAHGTPAQSGVEDPQGAPCTPHEDPRHQPHRGQACPKPWATEAASWPFVLDKGACGQLGASHKSLCWCLLPPLARSSAGRRWPTPACVNSPSNEDKRG